MASLRIMDLVDSHGEVKRKVLLQRNMTKGKKQRRFYPHNEKLIKVIHEYLRFRKQNKNLFTRSLFNSFSERWIFGSEYSSTVVQTTLQECRTRWY